MLADDQILYLLARCERETGRILPEVRGNLQTDNWLSTVWELMVADAVSQLGTLSYEEATAGSSRPDFLFTAPNGERAHLEAAFAFSEDKRGTRDASAHPVSKILRRKARQARNAQSVEPFVVVVASDRVFSFERLRSYQSNSGHAVHSFFAGSTSISAAIVVPILLRPETFAGFTREAHPAFFLNPNARNALPDTMCSTLKCLDFSRWKIELWTEGQKPRTSLRARLDAASGRQLDPSEIDSNVRPEPEPFRGQAYWSYTWNFHCLRIGGGGGWYWLYDNRESIAHYSSPEKAAESAAALFQSFPASDDTGVPSDLREWAFHKGGKS